MTCTSFLIAHANGAGENKIPAQSLMMTMIIIIIIIVIGIIIITIAIIIIIIIIILVATTTLSKQYQTHKQCKLKNAFFRTTQTSTTYGCSHVDEAIQE